MCMHVKTVFMYSIYTQVRMYVINGFVYINVCAYRKITNVGNGI